MALHGVSIALACRTFEVSETCYRYSAKLNDENEQIADLLIGLIGATQLVKASCNANFRRCYGPEYVSGKLMEWAATQGIALSHIQPGKPQQNAYVERYNRTVRHEWLDQYIIESIEEAQEFWTYNNERPNMGIGGITPSQKLKMAA